MWRFALAIALALTSVAHADDTIQRADEAFERGKALLATDLEAACAEFHRSYELNAQAIGTLLNVALCDEKLGRFASAHARFREARERAKELNMKVHQDAAEEHMAILEPQIPHVTLSFATPPIAGTKIVIDEKLLAFADISNHPIDPGAHVLVVSAPGHLAYETTFTIAAAEARTVDVPALERAVTSRSARRRIGLITTASGALMVTSSVVLGLVAWRSYDTTADGRCNTIMYMGEERLQCDDIGYADLGRARQIGTVGTVVGAVGVAALGVGLYLWLGAPTPREREGVAVVPTISGESAGVAAVGRF